MNWGNILCRLGLHDYKRLSRAVPVREGGEFRFGVIGGALGKCRRCSKVNMVACDDLDSYYLSDAKTAREWVEELTEEVA